MAALHDEQTLNSPLGWIIRKTDALVPRRFGLMATGALLLASLALGVVRGDHIATIAESLRDGRDALANAAGFRIANVMLTGRKHLTQDEILALGGVTGRRSLLFLDAANVRDKLIANPWIADATVLKLYPDKLQIDIKERSAFALWQKDGRVSVIAVDGAVLEPYLARPFVQLPLVVGIGAETHAKDFLDLLAKYPDVKNAVRAVVYVGERRWNLRLTNGADVRLPETGVETALATLSTLERDKHLFERDVTAIDMRLPNRVSLRLSEEAARARDEQLKDKKTKKRPGEA